MDTRIVRKSGRGAVIGVLVLGCGGTERPDEAGAPDPVEAATAVGEAPLPQGAQARSLLGEPLFAPTLPDTVRARHEANLDRARADVEAAPEDVDALIWLGRRLAYLGRYREAIEVYGRGLELAPDDPRLYRHRGHRWITVRRFDEAVADLRRAVALIEGTHDEVEPDGIPNARGIPTSTLHFNIWYHLGLAHYLRGELEQALLAWNECMEVSKHPDSVVATAYWLQNTLRRLGLEVRADEALEDVDADMAIIESGQYLDVLLLWKGERTADELLAGGAAEGTLESVTTAYGVGNWHHVNGRPAEALRTWRGILARGDQWAAFGYVAAEAEVAAAEGTGR